MHARPRPFGALLRVRFRAILLLGLVASFAVPPASWVIAQDYQFIAVGNGRPDIDCVAAGPNTVMDSVRAGDDVVISALQVITTGPNGICETPLGGDDQRPPNGVVLGRGLPNATTIVSGTSGSNDDGICNDPITAAGDDVIVRPFGTSEARMRAIRAGTNGVIDSTPGGDDVVTTVVCPGVDNTLQSLPPFGSDDLILTVSPLCGVCAGSAGCIIAGTNDVLETAIDPADESKDYVSTGANGVSETVAASDDFQEIAFGRGFPQTVCANAGPDGIAQATICGNSVQDDEENGLPGSDCDDGNTLSNDGCSAICRTEFCGDGVTQSDPMRPEECDDGNLRNDDACVVGCRLARCGDGFAQRGAEECDDGNTIPGDGCTATCLREVAPGCGNGVLDPGEQCDDGNHSDEDDCPTTCLLASCGDGFVHTKGTPTFEECDDGNTAPGDGCSPICTTECGNGVIDGACSAGMVGQPCNSNDDCDTSLGAGDGTCVAEACDPGAANLCAPGPSACSNVCQIAACGNSEVECQEQCDLGPDNGVPGSGCTATCTRNVVGSNELTNTRECLNAWTLDSAPQNLTERVQICTDGAPCDFDAIAGQCTFRVGVCLNRPGIVGCDRGKIRKFELQRLKVTRLDHAPAIQAIGAAVRDLAPATVGAVPDLCRKGARGETCTIPDNEQCDRAFGTGDGICDIGTGVVFFPPLDPADQGGAQLSACTPGVDVVVQAGATLKLRSRATQNTGAQDKDAIVLVCRP